MRGAWAVEPMIDAPDAVFASGAVLYAGEIDDNPSLCGDAPEVLHVADGRPMNREWLVRVEEINDRDTAEQWRRRFLFADSASLPTVSEDEVSVAELIGMAVEVEGRGPVGHVRDVYDAPQGFIIELETAHGRPLIPWHEDIVRSVDMESRTILLLPPDGLLD